MMIISYAGSYASQLRSLHCLTTYEDVDAAMVAISPVVGDLSARVEFGEDIYCYRSGEDAERDLDGSRAVVVLRNVTRGSIRTLRDEAGDAERVALCAAALDGDKAAWEKCVALLAESAVAS
jgi:hypothetical protein